MTASKSKNNFNDLFTNVSKKDFVVKGKDDNTVFQVDLTVALVVGFLSLFFFQILLIVFVILVATGSWYFETVKKKGRK